YRGAADGAAGPLPTAPGRAWSDCRARSWRWSDQSIAGYDLSGARAGRDTRPGVWAAHVDCLDRDARWLTGFGLSDRVRGAAVHAGVRRSRLSRHHAQHVDDPRLA